MRMKTKWGTRPRLGQKAQGESQQRADRVKSKMSRQFSEKTTPSEHTVTVTTQEALEGHREKTMRIASVENSTSDWVSISSAAVLDVTHCDLSMRSARDEMRRVVGSSAPDVIIGSDKDQNRRCRKKDKDHVELLCVLCTKRRRRAVAASYMSWHQQ